jgi:short-subunit dehydrogenase
MTTAGRTQAVVIGAGPGLGRSLALRLARAGLDVTLIARDEGRLKDLAAEIAKTGARVRAASADAAVPGAVAAAVREASAAAPVGALAYNASMWGGRLAETDLGALRAATEVNLHSLVAAVQAARADLTATSGAVLITGGGLALTPMAEHGVLSVGKAALRAAGHVLADDLSADGVTVRMVTVNGPIAPGTPFDPDIIADAFWRIRQDPASGVELVFDGAGGRRWGGGRATG